MLEPIVPTESSQDKGNFCVRSRPEENYPEWKPGFKDDLQSVLRMTGDLCFGGALEDFTYEITRSTVFSVNNSLSKMTEN